MRVAPKIGRIYDYVSATANEIAIDGMFFQLASLSPVSAGFLPRVSNWLRIGKQVPILTLCVWWMLRYVWIAGGAIFFFFLQFIPRWLNAGEFSTSIEGTARDTGYVLAFSSRVEEIVTSQYFSDLPTIWITMPWTPLRQVPLNAKCRDVFTLLSRGELWQAYCDAVTATYILFKRKRTSKWVLQSYTAFRWFAVRAAVDKLPGRLVMADHFDRWAVLVDSSVHTQKFVVAPSGDLRKRELVLVQHGSLGSIGEGRSGPAPKLRLYRKLRAVTHLYAYGVEAEHAFKSDVLSTGCVSRGIDVSYFTPNILLTKDDRFTGFKLLFVGHPLCEELHRHCFYILRDKYNICAYYKPHPRAPMSKSMRQVEWNIIDNPNVFPSVDLLISYQSTLVVEYAGEGVPAAVHAINLEKEQAMDFLACVFEKINIINND